VAQPPAIDTASSRQQNRQLSLKSVFRSMGTCYPKPTPVRSAAGFATFVAYSVIWGYHAGFFCQIQLYGFYSPA
ncbi:MAG: hypothetical protein OXQ86_07425, partial [Gammaproteobacteria bacterium]|nr:hypothetical protein [Gammaproteobacteria bacterium]